MYPPYPSLLVWVRKILISIHNNSFATYIRQGKIPDGIASVVCRTGCLPFIPAVDRFVQSRRTGRRNAVISVCFNDRDDSLGTKGMGNVPVPGRCGCYREKIRYADGTFCSSSNRSRK